LETVAFFLTLSGIEIGFKSNHPGLCNVLTILLVRGLIIETMNYCFPTKWILLTGILFFGKPGITQPVNPSFENWYPDSNGVMRLVGWIHADKNSGPGLLNGTYRETNSQHLDYAATLSRWYDYTWDKLIQKTPINSRPAMLTGFYRYVNNDLTGNRDKDTAYVFVAVTRWNTILNRSDTIGQGIIELGPAADFQSFECPVIYSSPGAGDSLYIEISPSKFNDLPSYCVSPGWCSYLTVDNLELKGSVSNLSGFTIYPNPSRDKIFIPISSSMSKGNFMIMNTCGQVVLRKTVVPGMNELNISMFSRGIYFLVLREENGKLHALRFLKD
jgi:hypothetical protein